MIGNHSSVHGGITSVISQIRTNNWEEAGIEMKFIPSYKGGSNIYKILYFTVAYVRILITLFLWKPDLVYMHMSHHGSFSRKYAIHKMCTRFKIPDVIHLHGSEFEKWYYEADLNVQSKIRKLLRECRRFIVLGNKWNSIIQKIEPSTKTVVISNAVHIPEKTAKWDENLFQVLFLGVLVKRKGVHDLLKAVERIKQHGLASDLKVIIAGIGEEEEHLKEIVHRCKIESAVEFVGWIDGEKKQRLLETSQMLVLPSYNEGLPVSILEAISYGLPVVATNVGDVSSVVRNDENGFLIQPGDIEALADAIERIKASEKNYKAFSQKSREIAEQGYSDQAFFEAITECFIALNKRAKKRSKYVLRIHTVGSDNKQYMATQAVRDITTICMREGYRPLTRYTSSLKGMSSVLDVLLLLKLMFLPSDTIMVYQHPTAFSQPVFSCFMRMIKLRKIRMIALIHDLEMYRIKNKTSTDRERKILAFSKAIISHNERMTQFLVEQGFDEQKIVNLEIFDYLTERPYSKVKREIPVSDRSLIVAGNLNPKKCGYLYKLIEKNCIPLDLYGVNFEAEISGYRNIKYHGAFPATELPYCIAGGFGLVWDGDSVETCSGNYGEYLKINNPHKTSLYLASGIPVVIWKKAALADFVVKNRLGFTIDSLTDIEKKIASVTSEEYKEIKDNAVQMAERMTIGSHTLSAIHEAERLCQE